jgi:hypothetical protein
VVPEDQWNSFEITGGTNFRPGWYQIVAVDVRNNTWTVDRGCTKKTTASAMTGYYCPTLIRDHGVGNYIRGIGFLGRTLGKDPLAGSIGYHVVTSAQSGVACGKHHLQNCTWSAFHTGVLFGPGMAAYDETTPYGGWYGATQLSADESVFTNCRFYDVVNCFLFRNTQAVEFTVNHVKANALAGTVFRFDSGGKIIANGIYCSGNRRGSTQRILFLGTSVSGSKSGLDPYIINGFSFDGGNNTRNPQLVVTDWSSRRATALVVFNGGRINRAAAHDRLPLIDIQSQARVVVRDVVGGFWAGSIRLRYGNKGDKTSKPSVRFEGVQLGVSNPQDIIDSAGSDAGCKVYLRDCTDARGEALVDQELTSS